MGTLAIALTIFAATLPARDRAVVPMMIRADPALSDFAVISRTPATENLDLLVVLGTPAKWPLQMSSWQWWGPQRKLGLFLQERDNPDKIYTLAIEAGSTNDCAMRIERASATNLVVSCLGEKSTRHPHQSFLFDPRAKTLVKRYEYDPFAVYRVFASGNGALLVASDKKVTPVIRYDPAASPMFTLLSEDAARPWLAKIKISNGLILPPQPDSLSFGGTFELIPQYDGALLLFEHTKQETIEYPLPQSSYAEFAAARPQQVKNGLVENHTQIAELFGPRQVEDGRLWFGKAFYDGEGMTGVGGFGYFDAAERKYRIFSPPEVVDWSISAMALTPDAVWLGLVQSGEWGPSPGGLLRWDRASESARRFEFPDILAEMLPVGDRIVAGTSGSIAIIRDDAVERYLIHRASDGRIQIVEASPATITAEAAKE